MNIQEVDNQKLIYHPKRVAEWKEKGDCFPVYVEIGPSNSCNHKCIFCALDWIEKGKIKLDRDNLLKNLEDMANSGVKSVMFAGEGEPLTHPDIGLFIGNAKKYGLDTALTTNGTLFNKEKRESSLPYLSWIRYSVDSGSPENYALIHGTSKTDFGRVICNIGESVKFKQANELQITLGVQFVMIPQNIGEATKLAKILKDIGADNLQVKPYSHHPGSHNDFSLDRDIYNRLEEQLMKFDSPDFRVVFRRATLERLNSEIPYDKCYGLSFFSLIDAKGNVMPCGMFYDNDKFIYGNINENSFSDIWRSERRKSIITDISQTKLEGCRKGCRLDAVNRYLSRLNNPQAHDNFI